MIEPTSFLDCFDPPDGLVGWGAVLIAMTADRGVLSEAMTRFSCSGPRGRECLGIVTTYLLLFNANVK